MEKILIGGKDISRYIHACFYALNDNPEIQLVARGSYIKKAIDILAILIRDHLDEPKYNIIVKSEPFENRNVSAIEIILSGKKKVKKE